MLHKAIQIKSALRSVNSLTDLKSFGLQLEDNINLSHPLKNEEQLDSEAELFVGIMLLCNWLHGITPQILSHKPNVTVTLRKLEH